MTDDGKTYKLVYDAFGRLMEVRDRAANTLLKQYRYDGLGQRVAERFASGGISDTTPWAFFVYDDRWRIVAVYRPAPALVAEVPAPTAFAASVISLNHYHHPKTTLMTLGHEMGAGHPEGWSHEWHTNDGPDSLGLLRSYPSSDFYNCRDATCDAIVGCCASTTLCD